MNSDGEKLPYDETILIHPEILDGTRVLLHAERPAITKTWVRGRLAMVTRRAVTVRKTFEVDVLHEELVVEYVAGDGTPTLELGSDRVVVQLRAERVEFVKTVHVVEEIICSKRVETATERFELDLRREELATVETPLS